MLDEKDYIMRMVKEFAIAIGRIIGLKAENKIEESQKVLSETLEDFTDLNIEVLEALPYEILIRKVSGSRQINTDKCLMLSELLTLQADIYETRGEKARARNLALLSLDILLNVLLNDDDSVLEQNQGKVEEIIERLGWFYVSDKSKLLLFKYYELTANYAKAEDVLSNLIESDETNDDILAKGIAFYERLTNKNQTELEKGNLPIEEVLEGLANLKEIRIELLS